MECASLILRIEVGNASLPPDAIEASVAQGDEAMLESTDAHDILESEPLLRADLWKAILSLKKMKPRQEKQRMI
jgi:hypothetical protein